MILRAFTSSHYSLSNGAKKIKFSQRLVVNI
jgi:hypothetical protein